MAYRHLDEVCAFCPLDFVQFVHLDFECVELRVMKLDLSDDPQAFLAGVDHTDHQVSVPVILARILHAELVLDADDGHRRQSRVRVVQEPVHSSQNLARAITHHRCPDRVEDVGGERAHGVPALGILHQLLPHPLLRLDRRRDHAVPPLLSPDKIGQRPALCLDRTQPAEGSLGTARDDVLERALPLLRPGLVRVVRGVGQRQVLHLDHLERGAVAVEH
mmetsp:Transcript_133767/g.198914  ORF Transcript_133767/g.198914 Transcript_133767/m.198914 type:complete len:219 (-) Transcript_133767:45-701(-)